MNTRPLVLLVDDSAPTRRAIRRIVETLGYRVMEADSGAAAIKACAQTTPDLVLLDLVMNDGMDGFDTLARLRAAQSRLPVVIVSADNRDTSRDAASKGGAVGFLDKPVSVEELRRTLAIHTGNSGP